MGIKLSEEDIILYKKIDDILWLDWDPIGTKSYDGPRDEYSSYVPQVFSLKKTGANRTELAEFLFKVETDRMGMPGTFENCLAIADKIINQ